jgi:hypothetical protein
MGRTSRKLNFLIRENICRDLEMSVPAGKRSELVNQALHKELDSIRRRKAAHEILASSSKGKKFSNRQFVGKLAKDRTTH